MTLDDILDVLEEARMREHFRDDLYRMEASEHFGPQLKEFRKMYRRQSKWAAKRILDAHNTPGIVL